MVGPLGVEWGPFREDLLALNSLICYHSGAACISNGQKSGPQLGSIAEKSILSHHKAAAS